MCQWFHTPFPTSLPSNLYLVLQLNKKRLIPAQKSLCGLVRDIVRIEYTEGLDKDGSIGHLGEDDAFARASVSMS